MTPLTAGVAFLHSGEPGLTSRRGLCPLLASLSCCRKQGCIRGTTLALTFCLFVCFFVLGTLCSACGGRVWMEGVWGRGRGQAAAAPRDFLALQVQNNSADDKLTQSWRSHMRAHTHIEASFQPPRSVTVLTSCPTFCNNLVSVCLGA